MIGTVAGDDFLAGLVAARVGRVPHELDLAVIGFRAGIGEEHLAHLHRRHSLQLLGQCDAGLVALAAKNMAEGQFADLLGSGIGQFVFAPSQRRAPQARHRLQIVLAVIAIDEHARTALDH